METALIIMAAGLGSRFAGGIKQLEPVGVHGEIIMDYSVHDAICAGFSKIIIVIRKEIEKAFFEAIGNKLKKICSIRNVEVKYVFQSLEDIPSEIPNGRVKPWGTGHAVLCTADEINCPFAVINADDYYGKSSFREIHNYLCTSVSATEYCLAGFILENTIWENSSVNRAICRIDEKNNLLGITETEDIVRCGNAVKIKGHEICPKSCVSMNMWGFAPGFFSLLEKGFKDFFENDVQENPLDAEYLLPVLAEKLLAEGKISVKVIPVNEKWLGTTYKEDIPYIRESLRQMTEQGIYRENLYSDLVD